MSTIKLEIPTRADIYMYIYYMYMSRKMLGSLLRASAMYCVGSCMKMVKEKKNKTSTKADPTFVSSA